MNTAPFEMPADPVLDNERINTLRFLSVDAVQKASSGHPGMPMGAVPWPMCCGPVSSNTIQPIPTCSTAIVSCSRLGTDRCCSTVCFISPVMIFLSNRSNSFVNEIA